MLRGSHLWLMMFVALAGCPGGNGEIGDACGGNDDCDGTLQCLEHRCVPRCARAPECGDGYSCSDQGLCRAATGQVDDPCQSEVQCAAGLSCQIEGAEVDGQNRPVSSCVAEHDTRPAGAACNRGTDCRNGTCVLGHCVDLCLETRDCAAGASCVMIPSELAENAFFGGCLPSKGSVTWPLPVVTPSVEVLLPVPDAARSVALVMSVDDPSQKVGVSSVLSPAGKRIYSMPCSPLLPSDLPCDQDSSLEAYFTSVVRHQPGFGQSVLAMPSGDKALFPGVYRVEVSSFRSNDAPGFGVPRVTAVVQFDSSGILDLHFFFLDLTDHPCAAMTNNRTLDAGLAQTAMFFQDDFLGGLRDMATRAGLSLGTLTYDDVKDHPELDGLDVAGAGALLALGKYATGVNVFFVRSLSPVGLQVFGANPGPAGLGGTSQSGIAIGLDTVCYRDWPQVSRLAAHALARYMGLYHNVELETAQHPNWRDLIDDSDDSSNNLMFFSEHADPSTGELSIGQELSAGQRAILRNSAVLR